MKCIVCRDSTDLRITFFNELEREPVREWGVLTAPACESHADFLIKNGFTLELKELSLSSSAGEPQSARESSI